MSLSPRASYTEFHRSHEDAICCDRRSRIPENSPDLERRTEGARVGLAKRRRRDQRVCAATALRAVHTGVATDAEETIMPMPLEGMRVLDWTIWQQGPVCSAILGDLGADVIKIEERVAGDPGRGMLRLAGLETSGRPNFYFTANNRNKRGMTLDLKKPGAC